jgi:hypothetical protein
MTSDIFAIGSIDEISEIIIVSSRIELFGKGIEHDLQSFLIVTREVFFEHISDMMDASFELEKREFLEDFFDKTYFLEICKHNKYLICEFLDFLRVKEVIFQGELLFESVRGGGASHEIRVSYILAIRAIHSS